MVGGMERCVEQFHNDWCVRGEFARFSPISVMGAD
jgi:hypothetical protein